MFSEQNEQYNVLPVVETMPADLLTPLAAYLKLAAGRENSFLLESVEGGETLARYSFIGVDPDMIVSGSGERVKISKDGETRSAETPMADFLREHFQKHRLKDDGDLPSFAGGAIGFLGFSSAAWFEPSLKKSIAADENEAAFMFCRTIVAHDHARQEIKIVSLVFADEAAGDENRLAELFRQAAETNRATRKTLEDGALHLPRPAESKTAAEPSSNTSQHDFEAAVRRIKEHIRSGDAYQVVISQCFSRETAASPVAIYRAMRSLNPSPYMFLLKMAGTTLIGASPEMLVRTRGQKIEYRPIAGTRPRGKTPEDDARLAREMLADKKEIAEHMMLVDLGRNDLGRVAGYGSVRVAELMAVEKYSHVQHIVSQLTAELAAGRDRFDALAACFPAGTVSGAPKVRAIEIISRLEPTPRGIYAGAVGYLDYSGNMDMCIAIRTMSLAGGVAKVQAGAGIVADSVPESEFAETVNKAKALLKAIDIAEGRI